MTLMKLRLDFLSSDLSQHFRIYLFGGLCTQVFYSWAWVIGDVKSFLSQKQKLYNHKPNIETEIFKT